MKEEKLITIHKQIVNFHKQLEAARNNPFLSLHVLNQFEDAVYASIEDLQEAFDIEYQKIMFSKINQGLGIRN